MNSRVSKIPLVVRRGLLTLFVCGFLWGQVGEVYSAEPLAVTVTPPLFQLTIGPGEFWSSTLKVVNTNTYDVTYYAEVVNFEPEGENGAGKFTPRVNASEDPTHRTFSLASWVEISSEPILVKAGSSAEIPFTVKVPSDAEPGGHYASILVGTRPSGDALSGPSVKISTLVSSLLLVRISGDIDERGRIREFYSEQSLYQTPRADFTLRFENLGNVHLRPRGDITLYNMWGKERGSLVINQNGNFGNVLPKSIRKFNFSWEGEESLFDIGRYSAVVTLGYGEEGKQNTSGTAYFWVIPIIPASITLGVIVGFLLIMTWFIRRYIQRALQLERQRFVSHDEPVEEKEVSYSIETLMEPIREGVIDLRSAAGGVSEPNFSNQSPSSRIQVSKPTISTRRPHTALEFVAKYRMFFLFLVVVLLCVGLLVWYLDKVLVPEKTFKIIDISAEELPAE